jgi:glutamate dehydrogenase (NAD(P)+)
LKMGWIWLFPNLNMGGNRLDELGAAGGGLVIALQALLNELPRLRVLPQFKNLTLPEPDQLDILLQGFGAVGANAARFLVERMPSARVTGVSDTTGYLFNEWGLPVQELYQLWQAHRSVSSHYYNQHQSEGMQPGAKYSTAGDDLLRESAFCLIPAAPVSNYLDTDAASKPSMTVDRMGHWTMIIEGANTYSPDPAAPPVCGLSGKCTAARCSLLLIFGKSEL